MSVMEPGGSETSLTETANDVQATRTTSSEVKATRTASGAVEATRTESSAVEVTRTESDAVEATRTESSAVEVTRTESSAVEVTRPESSAVEVTRTESSAVEATRTESGAVEATRTESGAVEATRTESGAVEATRTESDAVKRVVVIEPKTSAEAARDLAERRSRLRAEARKRTTKHERIKVPTVLQSMFRQRYQKRSVYYFTTGRKVDPARCRDVAAEPTPFWFPSGNEEFSYKVLNRTWCEEFRKQQAAYHVSKRPTYRSRQKQDLLERLYMPDETQDTPVIPAVLDIDPEYFSVVQGRPESRESFNIRRYIDDVRQTVKVRLQAGYNIDQVMKVDEQFLQEQRRIDRIKEKHKLYVDSFESFLSEDHGDSMKLLRQCETQIKKSEVLGVEYKRLGRLLAAIRCRVYILEELWRECKMFQSFLYHVSPQGWQEKQGMGQGRSETSVLNEDNSLFGRYRLASSGTIASLESLIDMFREDTEHEQTPKLYFTDPAQLLAVFENLERQNLNSILHLEELSLPLKTMREELQNAKLNFDKQIGEISEKVAYFQQQIRWENQRANDLEEEARGLIDGLFRDLIIKDDVLNLYIFVEDVFEATIAPNDNNLRLLTMTRAFESSYELMLRKLDDLPAGVVRITETEMYQEEARLMHAAMEATRRMHQMKRLTARLHRALAPPPPALRRRLMFRSRPPGMGRQTVHKERELTQLELDFLDFFTEYCEYTDDSRVYLKANKLPAIVASVPSADSNQQVE